MANLRDEVASLLRSGYTLVDNRILDAQGKVVRDKNDNQPINVKHASGYHYRRRLLAQLDKAGVLRPRQSRTTRQHAQPRKLHVDGPKNNPLLLASEILRDPRSSARERGMARAYNELFQTHTRVRALAQALGRELRERGDL